MSLKQKRQKIARVLREFKAGTLKGSDGKPVKSRQQAIAIAMSEAGMEKKDKSDAYWDAYIDTMCGSMSKEGMEEEEEEMDANPAEARCKGYLSSLRKRRKKG
ncbi:hypothetical protein S-CBS4_gp018 [Synechococcus phage S-CBS4]|uniref:hypothetical protein n=1 Tax=Synechococcus phage S-CBS4 TaxID=756275 RepID=UPI000246A6EA|nr:hypothetical protein S-CBS4_gp018 [Synechococcus phage S-CBS4]AEX55985.1 hypothetical protein S-CBS4_gp018 [Synechococcus phage S-CBS4]AGN30536.1 hypothetical protein SXAG_00089 [Synechococcus phage S-CBS4]